MVQSKPGVGPLETTEWKARIQRKLGKEPSIRKINDRAQKVRDGKTRIQASSCENVRQGPACGTQESSERQSSLGGKIQKKPTGVGMAHRNGRENSGVELKTGRKIRVGLGTAKWY